MIATALPTVEEMERAFFARDASYDGLFVTGVTTTGIFCRVSCPARKPKAEHLRFFRSQQEATAAGFRPCRRCRPLHSRADLPAWAGPLLDAVAAGARLRESDLRARGLDPARVRRAFLRHYGMSFQAFQRSHRLGAALAELRRGAPQTRTAFASGYESLSGFRHAYQRTFGTTPGKNEDVVIGYMQRLHTPIGTMLSVSSDRGVLLLEFLERRALEHELHELGRRLHCSIVARENTVSQRLAVELEAYFNGQLRDFTVPLQPVGTPFQVRVWDVLRAIPYGETRSYAAQALAIGQPTATRAVARANGDNKISIVIPCHRVIGSNGKLTGYGGGLWRKKFLLDLERNAG